MLWLLVISALLQGGTDAAEALAGSGANGMPWYVAALTGSGGLTVFAVALNFKKDKVIEAKDEELRTLHEERRKDLVSGMTYREQVMESLLKDNIEDRKTAQKMVDAVDTLAKALEHNHGTTEEVRGVVRRIESLVNRLEGRISGGGGGGGSGGGAPEGDNPQVDP